MKHVAQDLEPAERDPKKLRRTALILVGIMVFGSIGVLIAYNRKAEKFAEDDRPAFITRLRTDKHDFKLWRQDESEASLLDLAGDVFVIAPVVFEQPESWRETRRVLLDLKQRYGDRDDFHLVTITLDPENEPPVELARHADELGAELPFWWLAGAREESVHKYFKNVLQAGIMPERNDGKWNYDTSIIVVDRDRHVRQPTVRARKPNGRELNYRNPVRLDFEEAAEWDAEGRGEGLDKTNVETMEEMLIDIIDELLANPAEDPT